MICYAKDETSILGKLLEMSASLPKTDTAVLITTKFGLAVLTDKLPYKACASPSLLFCGCPVFAYKTNIEAHAAAFISANSDGNSVLLFIPKTA